MNQTAKFNLGYYVFLIVFLGMLSAFGPFVTDMYLSTLPSMAEIFHTTPSLVQMGLATSMLGLAVGQIFFGPLSDKYGRRKVLMAAMILFAVSTVVSIYSPSIEFFNICRFVQGLGGAGGMCFQGQCRPTVTPAVNLQKRSPLSARSTALPPSRRLWSAVL